MDLSKIITISGKHGLFKVIAQSKNSVIVESLSDKKRFPVYSASKVVSLDEISVFTTDEDKPLKEILLKIFEKENEKPTPDFKNDSSALSKYFEEILPEFDKERVYVSDIKKIINWYNLLVGMELISKEEEIAEPAIEENKQEETESSEKPEAANFKKKTKKKDEQK